MGVEGLRGFLLGADKKPETKFTSQFRPAFILLRISISSCSMFYRVQKCLLKNTLSYKLFESEF